MERKKIKRKENEEKSIFSLYMIGWRENEKKENESYIKIPYMSLL